MNLLQREATKRGYTRRSARTAGPVPEVWSHQMRKMVGTIVATAWAQFPNYPTVDSPRNQAGTISPFEMMTTSPRLPVQGHVDAF